MVSKGRKANMGEASRISSTTPVISWVRLYLSASAMVARAMLLRVARSWVAQGVGDAVDAAQPRGRGGRELRGFVPDALQLGVRVVLAQAGHRGAPGADFGLHQGDLAVRLDG